MSRTIALALGSLLAGCASSPGTRPSDMSVAEHEAAAAAAQAGASAQDGLHGGTMALECPAYARGDCSPYWTSVRQPSDRDRQQAEKHRDLAVKHRAASALLRETEARACTGIPAADRDMSPFNHREDIDRVEIIERKGRFGPAGPQGARVIFAARPGMTAEWLQRVIDCHQARWAALGSDDAHLAYCPLALRNTSASVTAVRRGFAVEILGRDERAGAEVARRAQTLAAVK